MTKRKSPFRHRVTDHDRTTSSGKKVHVTSYMRGAGKRRKKWVVRGTKELITKKHGPKPYTINFKYSNRRGDGESVVVIAPSYQKALDEAWEEKVDKRHPIEVEVIDPDWGRVFRAIGKGLKKVGKIGGKYAVKGLQAGYKAAKITGKAAAREVAYQFKQHRIKKLVEEAYSDYKPDRMKARAMLKRYFPDVYAMCDFSKEKAKRRTKFKPTRVVRVSRTGKKKVKEVKEKYPVNPFKVAKKITPWD